MSDCCEYAELRRRAEDAEFDLQTMTRARDRLLKQLEDLRAEHASEVATLKGQLAAVRNPEEPPSFVYIWCPRKNDWPGLVYRRPDREGNKHYHWRRVPVVGASSTTDAQIEE